MLFVYNFLCSKLVIGSKFKIFCLILLDTLSSLAWWTLFAWLIKSIWYVLHLIDVSIICCVLHLIDASAICYVAYQMDASAYLCSGFNKLLLEQTQMCILSDKILFEQTINILCWTNTGLEQFIVYIKLISVGPFNILSS